MALVLSGLVLPILWFDAGTLEFRSWVSRPPPHDWLDKVLFNPLRDFGGFLSQGTILALVVVFDPPRRRRVIFVLAALLSSFLAVQGIKIVSGRVRPEAVKAGESVFQFTGPWGGVFNDDLGSFPSGHAASAFTLAAFLAFTYPRGRWAFWLLAAGCGLARVAEARHFPTDVYAGALLGIASAMYFLQLEARKCGPPRTAS